MRVRTFSWWAVAWIAWALPCGALPWGAPSARAQEPVDLLHAVGTELAVSSAYRNLRQQVERLVDGDPTSAWNSATGDLVGAWIEVRLPADAEVTAIALVPGFARVSQGTDLFTGNHRVSAIRVLREGVEVGRFPVAHERPELVTIPVRGRGGVWRIELAELRAGTRNDWREACVSELRIFGRAPSVAPGTRTPRVAIGALPEAAVAVAVDVAALERAQRRDLTYLVREWRTLQSDYFSFAESTGEPEPDAETIRETERARAAILRRVTELVQPVDPARADAIRIAGATRLSGVAWRWEPIVRADLAAISAALDAVAERIGTDAARCRSVRALAELRLVRVAGLARLAAYFDEIDESEAMSMGDERPRGAERRSRSLGQDAEAFGDLEAEWSRNSRGVTTRLLRREAPTDERVAEDWRALSTVLPVARQTCGWPDP
jgi:hypothetical protein